MTKHQFTPTERFAVFVTHGEKCYMCNHPLDLMSMEVDHVIPESLLTTAQRLAKVLHLLGRSKQFEVNSYANWLPSCRSCNGIKRNVIFHPSPLIQLQLQKAERLATKASAFALQSVSTKNISKALNVLQRASTNGELTDDAKSALKPLILFLQDSRPTETVGNPVRLTPLYMVLAEDESFQTVQGQFGVGRRSTSLNRDPSWNCAYCGSVAAWNGARCVICGQLDAD